MFRARLTLRRANSLARLPVCVGRRCIEPAQLSDLDAVYAQVVRDLSTVYSIGYRPTNKTLDGKWRQCRGALDKALGSVCSHEAWLLRQAPSKNPEFRVQALAWFQKAA